MSARNSYFVLILGWHSLLLSLVAAGCVLRYKDRARWLMLGIFCLYFIGVHCLMAVLDAYFMPLVPILVAMVSLLVPGKPLLRTKENGWPRSFAAVILGSFLLLMGGTTLYANHSMAAYANQNWSASDIEGHLESELRRHSGDGWLTSYLDRLSRKVAPIQAQPLVAAATTTLPVPLDLEAALSLQELHRYGDSLKILDHLIKKSPSDGALWEQRGVTLALAGRDLEAIHDLRHSIRLAPTLSAYLSLGTIHSERKEWREARTIYEEALRSRPRKQALLITVIRASLGELPKSTGESSR